MSVVVKFACINQNEIIAHLPISLNQYIIEIFYRKLNWRASDK